MLAVLACCIPAAIIKQSTTCTSMTTDFNKRLALTDLDIFQGKVDGHAQTFKGA